MSSHRQAPARGPRLRPDERRRIVLDTATRLFTTHGIHAIGMDRLVAESGLAKMSVYRVFPTKDKLIDAYLTRLAETILNLIDDDIEAAANPGAALHAILDSIARDLRRPDFRGCPFGNAAGEYDDPDHPARRIAHDYRRSLLDRLDHTARRLDPDEGPRLARQLAALIDGAYLNTAHLGPDGPGSEAITLAHHLIDNR